ncbi:MAG: hypothetical protein Q9225_002120 [Loekoesia sp. 1 TL-2023]
MAVRYSLILAALAFSATADNVPAFADHNAGWCYFCSDDGAPPLCNSHCETAINRLCAGDLTKGWTDVEQGCKIQYFPPVYATTDGARQTAVPGDTCIQTFKGILNMCGKDAGDSRNTYDPAYCTTSGGGGTYGWNDDGSVMTGAGRYVIVTNGTDQCGQHEASWHQATSIIQWNDSWVGPDDQVILDTNPPAASVSAFPEPPAPNPECEHEVCDIYDHPYFARKGKANWSEKPGTTRHQVQWEGFSDDDRATALFNSLHDRCHVFPDNFQPYKDGDTHVADFNLPSADSNDLCWCIADAVYDASVGISIDRDTWCEGAPIKASHAEFNVVGSLGTTIVECVDSDSWRAANFVKEDCYVAVQELYKWDYRFHPDHVFTFFSSGSSSRHTSLAIQTPKRYTTSSCTLALVTLNKLAPYNLPGHLPHGSQPVDKATFRDIYQATRTLEEQCIAPSGRPGKVGWTVVGQYELPRSQEMDS